MRRLAVTLMVLAAVCGFWTNAYAYLDPGSGSLLIQSILAGILFLGSGLAFFWGKIKAFFKRSPEGDQAQTENSKHQSHS